MREANTLAIYYEHPDWFRPLFAELGRRDIPYVALDATRHSYDPSEPEKSICCCCSVARNWKRWSDSRKQ